MRLLRALGAGLLLAVSMVVAGAAPSFACSCAESSPAESVAAADVVVVGVVTGRQGPPWRPVMSSADPAVYTVEVERVLAGEAARVSHVRSADSGASCGLELVETGSRYVVFADRQGEELWAGLCGGTGPADPGYLAEIEVVTGPGAPPSADVPAGAPPVAASAGLAAPAALGAGLGLALLTGGLWLRHLRG